VVANGTRHVDERLLAEFDAQRAQFDRMREKRPQRLAVAGSC